MIPEDFEAQWRDDGPKPWLGIILMAAGFAGLAFMLWDLIAHNP